MPDGPWRIGLSPPARRQLARLPESVAAAIVETFTAIAANPRRLGRPLHFELSGQYAARRGPYRIVYELDERKRVVRVVAIGHRRRIYRPR